MVKQKNKETFPNRTTGPNRAAAAQMEFLEMDQLAARSSMIHNMTPLSKLWIAVFYILVTVSFHKYDISGLFVMVLFPLLGYQLSYIPVRTCFHKLRVVMPLVCAVGLLNPFYDRQILITIGSVGISGGVISMLTLMMKGVFCLMMSFLLVATTGITGICSALRQIHCPEVITTLLLLTYRYISLLLEEVSTMTTAYHLRAPGQKGIRMSAWGSFLGQLVLRSMDRAQGLYESMMLRGFHGEFHSAVESKGSRADSAAVSVICSICVLACRWYNIPALLNSLVMF